MIRKKICFVIPSLHAGGMERVMSELLDEFSKKEQIEMHIILYGIDRNIFYAIPENVKIHLPKFKFNNRFRLYFTLKTIWYLRNQIKAIDPVTILSFGEIWNNFVLLSCYGLRYPVYVSDRCQPNKSLGKLHDWLRIKLYPTAKGVVAQTKIGKEIFEKMYVHSNIEVIGNPIRPIATNSKIQKENIVLTVGRLITSKHHDELIKTFLKANQKDWKLIIVGDDAIKQQNKVKLLQLIKSLKAENQVILAGKQSNVEQYYLKSKLFAFTSSSEGFPNVIGEAQAAGLPVITFDCISGPSEMIVNQENGFLIPLFDYELFQEKLILLMNDDQTRQQMGANAKRSIAVFSKKVIADKYLNFILGE